MITSERERELVLTTLGRKRAQGPVSVEISESWLSALLADFAELEAELKRLQAIVDEWQDMAARIMAAVAKCKVEDETPTS